MDCGRHLFPVQESVAAGSRRVPFKAPLLVPSAISKMSLWTRIESRPHIADARKTAIISALVPLLTTSPVLLSLRRAQSHTSRPGFRDLLRFPARCIFSTPCVWVPWMNSPAQTLNIQSTGPGMNAANVAQGTGVFAKAQAAPAIMPPPQFSGRDYGFAAGGWSCDHITPAIFTDGNLEGILRGSLYHPFSSRVNSSR